MTYFLSCGQQHDSWPRKNLPFNNPTKVYSPVASSGSMEKHQMSRIYRVWIFPDRLDKSSVLLLKSLSWPKSLFVRWQSPCLYQQNPNVLFLWILLAPWWYPQFWVALTQKPSFGDVRGFHRAPTCFHPITVAFPHWLTPKWERLTRLTPQKSQKWLGIHPVLRCWSLGKSWN